MNFAAGHGFDVEESAPSAAACRLCDEARSCYFKSLSQDGGRCVVRYHDLARGDALETSVGGCLQIWTIVQGHAAICTGFRDGRRQILSIEEDGDVICGVSSSEESEQTLQALTDCRICEIDLSAAMQRLQTDADFLAMAFHLVHQRLIRSMSHVATLGRLDSQERVLYFLAEMAARRPGRDQVVTLPMSREDIADYLGLNTDSVSRLLSRLRKSGLVRFLSPTEYTMPDLDAVARRLPVAIPHRPTAKPIAQGGVK